MTNEEMSTTLLEIKGKMDAIMQSLNSEQIKPTVEEDCLRVGDVLKDSDETLWVVCALTSGEQAWLFSREKGGLLTHRKTWQGDCIEYGFTKTGDHTGMIEDMFDSLSVNCVN